MAADGLDFSELQSTVRGSASDAVGLLRDNRIDAMFYTVGGGSAAITEAAQTTPIKVVEISDDEIQALRKKYAFYTPFTIPADTYPDMKQDVQTVTLKAMLAVDQKLPEEAVYQFTKTIFGDKKIGRASCRERVSQYV